MSTAAIGPVPVARRVPLAFPLFVVAGLVAIGVATAMRNAGLWPVVLSDEYRYSIAARLQPFATASVPNYLFLVVYRATDVCGDAFLICGRWLNLAFFLGAAPIVYRIARRVLSRRLAVVVAALALIGPFSTYTAYFMPESAYWFGFWVVTAMVLGLRPDTSLGRHALAGAAIGALALVKPHAIFLLPPVIAFVAIEAARAHGVVRGVIVRAALIPAAALAVKFALGYTIAGSPALTWFGTFYAGMASTAGAPTSTVQLAGRAADAAWNLSGHAMALVLLFALPIAVLASAPFARGPITRRAPADDLRRLRLYTALVLGALVATATVFTVAVAGQGPYETLNRLHARYYDFAFPLLFVVGAASVARQPSRPLRLVFALAVAAILVFAVVAGLQPFGNGVVDYPELQGVTARSAVKNATAILGLASLVLWVLTPRFAALWFVLAVLPFALGKGSISASEQLQGRRMPDAYDLAGVAAHDALGRDDAARTIVFGDDAAGVYRTLFQLDSAAATATRLDIDAPIGEREWPASRPWAIVVGDHRLDGIDADRVDHAGFTLLHRRPAVR